MVSIIINSNLNSETNISKNNFNNNIKPTFPPILTLNDLIENALKSSTSNNNKPKSLPNAFIAYRMALVKEYRIKSRKLPSMGELSKIAKDSWNIEPKQRPTISKILGEFAKIGVWG